MFLVKLIKEINQNTKRKNVLPPKKHVSDEKDPKPQSTQIINQNFGPKPEEKGSSMTSLSYMQLDMENENCEYEMASSDDEGEFIPVTQTTTKKEKEFVSLDGSDLINKQQSEIIDISNTLGVPVCISGTLIRAYQWNQEKLYSDFFENKNLVCKKAGLDPSYLTRESLLIAGTKDEEFECGICFDDVPGDEMMSLSCNHFICISCWQNYLHSAINEGPSCLLVTCPFPKCDITVNESIVSQTVQPDFKKKYEKYLSRSFVDDNPKIKWCPAPDCGKAIYCPNTTNSAVNCACGYSFCFKCNSEEHSPATCEQVKLWMKKASDESETGNYLVANTKDCPKCNRSIEKNGGCNHMSCTQCKYEFCWVCMGEWKKLHGTETGGYYACNRFKEEDLEKLKKKDYQTARAALEKYVHYFQRYQNHERSLKLEEKLKEKSMEKLQNLEQTNTIYSSWIDVDYVEKAIEQLRQCRLTLKYSYVYAYYLEDESEKNLFEYLQQELEKNTEKLSGILEGEEEYSREDVLSLTKTANTRMNHLITGVENGLTL